MPTPLGPDPGGDYRKARRDLSVWAVALLLSQLALFFAVWALVEQNCR